MPRTAITTPRLVSRNMGGSTLFNGTTSKIDCGAINPIGTGNKTISFWAKPSAPTFSGTTGRVVDDGQFLVYLADGVWVANNGTSAKVFATNASMLTMLAAWIHVTIVRNSDGTVRAYVNGMPSYLGAVACGTPTAASTNFFIGNRNAADRTFNGKIAEVKIYNSALTAAQALTLYTTGSVSGVTPVASYALNDTPSTYIDSIAGNNGTGTATTYSLDTPINQRTVVSNDMASLAYSTTSTYIDIGTAFSVANRTTFTVSTAVIFDTAITPSTIMHFISQRRSGNGYLGAWRMALNNGKFEFYAFNTGGGEICNVVSDISPVAGRWYTMTCVFDPVAVRAYLYINGKLEKSVAAGAGNFDSTIAIGIGKNFRDNNQPLIGKMAKFYIWNGEALTASEVADLHFNRKVKASTYLKCSYEHNEGAGTIAYDSSGNGNNGTITGATWSSDTPSKVRTVVGGNLVKNGGFEYAPVVNVAQTTINWLDGTVGGSTTNSLFRWSYYAETGTGEVRFDPSEKHSGSYSLKISTLATGSDAMTGSALNSNASRIAECIKVLPSTSYTMTYWMKTNLVSGSSTSGAFASAVEFNADGATSANTLSGTYVLTTTGWTQYTVTFTTNSATRLVLIRARVKGNDGAATLIMDAWFDDITLTKTTPNTRTSV